jgi:hypothetical protein
LTCEVQALKSASACGAVVVVVGGGGGSGNAPLSWAETIVSYLSLYDIMTHSHFDT